MNLRPNIVGTPGRLTYVEIVNEPGLKIQKTYTWNDYQSWPDDERWEIIKGQPYAMSPSPASRHQLIVSALSASLFDRLRGTPCRAFVAPMDLKLSD